RIWTHAGKKSDGGQLSRDEYISLMFDKKIDSKTNQWRKLFAQFDQNGTGWATKEEVLQGLQKMGLGNNEQMKKIVEEMDGDNDNKIFYTEFLKKQLRQKASDCGDWSSSPYSGPHRLRALCYDHRALCYDHRALCYDHRALCYDHRALCYDHRALCQKLDPVKHAQHLSC
ncbi:hypothetical protein RRG08_051748, partial [Elysia crispata]